jgi:hypothetical protein
MLRRVMHGLARATTVIPLLLALSGAVDVAAQTPEAEPRLPFPSGERLTYRVRTARFGDVGQGVMWVEGPVEIRGRAVYVLHSDVRSRVGPLKAENHSASWLDALRMTSLRFEKRERQPLSKRNEAVELFPAERRWEGADGTTGASPTDDPLDELSFIYFIRTLRLPADTTYVFDRHFDPARNPIIVRVTGRETITIAAGEFRTVAIEMRVNDPQRYRGEGVIRIHFTDDHCRLPVRIESVMPIVGATVLTLESHTHPPAHFATQVP